MFMYLPSSRGLLRWWIALMLTPSMASRTGSTISGCFFLSSATCSTIFEVLCETSESPITRCMFCGGSRRRDPPLIRTIPPYVETVVSVGLARPFCTVLLDLKCHVRDIFAGLVQREFVIDGRQRGNRYCSRRAEAGRTRDLGVDVDAAHHAHRLETPVDIRGLCPLGPFGIPHGDKHPGLYGHGYAGLSVYYCMLAEQKYLARRTPRCQPRSPQWLAYPTTSLLSPVTSPLVAYRISFAAFAPSWLQAVTIAVIGPYPQAVTRRSSIRR